MTPSASEAPPAERIAFQVDAARCIGCVACVNVFPQVFRMDGDRAVTYAAAPGEVATSRVLRACPVGAIARTTAAPAPAAPADGAWPEAPGWMERWATHRDEPEELAERERRYGRVHDVREIRSCYVGRIELPRRMPHHPLLYRYGASLGAPEYDCELVQVGARAVSVRARLLDPLLRHLTGKLNSFPIGLKVDFQFPKPVGATFARMDADTLWVYALPVDAGEPTVVLSQVIREQLAAS